MQPAESASLNPALKLPKVLGRLSRRSPDGARCIRLSS